ncbi:MAG: murein biosynthesis integral membrane protein MurJ [Cumulibacter sp.]
MSLIRSAGQVAVGTLISRITGFARTIVLAALLGLTLTNDAYNIANTLPKMVFELLLGGVLTSVVVPLLVRAEKQARETSTDPNAFAQRLFSLAAIGLIGATVIGMLIAGLLVTMMGLGPDRPNHDIATLMTILMLPQMIFFGLGALAGAVINTRGSFLAPAWAPVANNIVVIGVALAMIAMRTGAAEFSTTEIVLLSLGTTAGIVVQAALLIPSWRKVGFRWKWRTDFRGVGLGEVRNLMLWMLGYVVVGQIGYIGATNVANYGARSHAGMVSQWTYADLLFQLPYGILGVSLLTALMPKLSRAARDDDMPKVKRYLADSTRLTGLGMLPISMACWILAVPLTVLFFDGGQFDGDGARYTGLIFAAAAFGLLPYSITLLQLRVFFAVKDARTPTLIMVGIVGLRIVLSLLCLLLPTYWIAVGLGVAFSLSFVGGAIIGEVVLHRRFGHLGTRAVLLDLGRIAAASLVGVVVATPVYLGTQALFSGADTWNIEGLTGVPLLGLNKLAIAIVLILTAAVGLVVFVLAGLAFGVRDLQQLLRRFRGGGSSGDGGAGAEAPVADPDAWLLQPVPLTPSVLGIPATVPVNEAMAERTPPSNDDRPTTGRIPKPSTGWQLLGVTALGLVIALVIGWFAGVFAGKMFGPEDKNDNQAAPTSSASATPTDDESESGQPIQIVGATLFDPPPGDGAENVDRIDLSYDGQPGTTWPTLQYQGTAEFANLKPGVGIVYDLGSEQTISKIDIVTTLPGATVEIRSGMGTSGEIDDFPIIGDPVTLQTNTTVDMPADTKTQYVLIWITQLVPQQGYFQAALSEVTIFN